MIAPVKRLALAPAAAADDHQAGLRVVCCAALDGVRLGLRHNIRSVGDELAIDAKNGFERAFDLRLGIVLRLQSTHGCVDQSAEDGNIFRNSEAELNVCSHCHSKAAATR